MPQAGGLFVPLLGAQSAAGVLGVRPDDRDLLRSPEQRQLLEACAGQLALALERDQLAMEASQMLLEAETERLRSSLLSSVSHDLRTPLASIAGASSTLLTTNVDDGNRRELLQSIYDESHRLSRLVDNLLEMTKIEAECLGVHKQWEVVEEIIGAALQRSDAELKRRTVTTKIPANLPMVEMDAQLIEQVLVNLLDNALKYTPADSPLEISARHDGRRLTIEVRDHGPGIPLGDERRVFEKFYRCANSTEHRPRGSGLGLAICKAIIEMHGGDIRAAGPQRMRGLYGDWGAHLFALSMADDPRKVDPHGALRLHPDDADRLGILPGDRVRLHSSCDSVEFLAKTSEDVLPGTAVTAKSRWPGFEREGLNVNALNPGLCADLGEGTAVNSLEVRIEVIE